MKPNFRPTPRLLTLLAALCLLPGCGIGPPPDDWNAAAHPSPLANAIVVRSEALPLDEPAPHAAILTLQEATSLALRHDPRIQAALARVRVQRAEAWQSQLLPNPIVSVAVRIAEGGMQPTIEASIAADLLALLQRPGRISAADNRLRAASAEAVVTVHDVWREVQISCITVQSAEERLTLLEESAAAITRFLGPAEARLERGEAIRLDVSTLRAQRLDVQLQLAEARIDRREARLRLARLIGHPSAAADWTIEKLTLSPPLLHDEMTLINLALTSRPEIARHKWELNALGDDARLARWSIDELSAGIDAESDGSATVGPAISAAVPIFDWGQARQEIAAAQILEARHHLAETSREIIEQVRVAHATAAALQELLARIEADLLPLQRQRLEDTQAGFDAGTADVFAILLAERDLLDTRFRLADLRRRALLAQVDLQYALGISQPPPSHPAPATTQGVQP